ncbi:unnamed protein product, partial [Owenia fusiformis]
GEDSTSASLTVKAGLKEQEVTPEFSEKLEDIKDVEQGKAAEFRVKVKAFPDAEVSWCKDDVLLKEDDSGHFTFSHEEDVHSLKIQDVTPEDSGTYTCKAKNDLGEDSTSASLTVKGTKYE